MRDYIIMTDLISEQGDEGLVDDSETVIKE